MDDAYGQYGGGDADWIFYKDRPEWNDLEPVCQKDGPYPVVMIAYSDKFRDIYDYFRAVLAKKEVSDRAFQLTEDATLANPSNYTAWHYRRILLKELNLDLNDEMKFIQATIEDHPKNYQVWYHRQVIVDWLNDASHEKTFTGRILQSDAKNYHAWQHRQWVIKKYNLWDGELQYAKELLEHDIRNNSAWNYRYFIITGTSEISDEILTEEIKYTLDQIQKAPHNESSWNYLRGILQDKGLTKFSMVSTFIEMQYESGCKSPYLLAFMIDSIEERLLAGENDQLCLKALELCDLLASEHDVIRKEYWNFVARNLGNLYGPEEARAKRSQSTNNFQVETA